MLRIALDRDAPRHHDPNEKGTAARDISIPKSCSLSFSALREESSAAWMNSQDVTHAAHAFDPWVLDVYSVSG
jgi:hypothetical protein